MAFKENTIGKKEGQNIFSNESGTAVCTGLVILLSLDPMFPSLFDWWTATLVTILVRINVISWSFWCKQCERGVARQQQKERGNTVAQTQSPNSHRDDTAQENSHRFFLLSDIQQIFSKIEKIYFHSLGRCPIELYYTTQCSNSQLALIGLEHKDSEAFK